MNRTHLLPIALMAAALSSASAQAACDGQLAAATKAEGEAVPAAFEKLVACDKKTAEDNFLKIMTGAGDLDSLVSLSIVGIDSEVWNPVWTMPGTLKDYEVRDDFVAAVGQRCTENEKILPFLQGAYYGLNPVEFGRWGGAIASCESEGLNDWLVSIVENPPAKLYDEKWSAMADAYVDRAGSDALGALAKGAVKAAGNGGPYKDILAKMDAAVQPSMGEEMSAADMKTLEDALVSVAKELDAEKARDVADCLANSGSEDKAASLLPTIYADRVQPGGGFLYAAVSLELADCDGTKSAVVHAALVEEGGSRYIIQDDLAGPMRAFKPRLGKCTSEGDWLVLVDEKPVQGDDELDAFASQVQASYEGKGYQVKVRGEKPVSLP